MRKDTLWSSKPEEEQKLIVAMLVDAMLNSDVATTTIEKTLQKFISKGYVKGKFVEQAFNQDLDESTPSNEP